MNELCKDCHENIYIKPVNELFPNTEAWARTKGFCGTACMARFELPFEQAKERVKQREREIQYAKEEWKMTKARERKENSKFYTSKEWRELRYKILNEHGSKCMCCGRTPSQGIEVHVDHIKPISKSPHLALIKENLQILCIDCNFGRSNED